MRVVTANVLGHRGPNAALSPTSRQTAEAKEEAGEEAKKARRRAMMFGGDDDVGMMMMSRSKGDE